VEDPWPEWLDAQAAHAALARLSVHQCRADAALPGWPTSGAGSRASRANCARDRDAPGPVAHRSTPRVRGRNRP
jgi:hypothetical protein